MDSNGEEGWPQYRIQVVSELKRINETIEKLADSHIAVKIDVANLKLQAAMIGGAAGILTAIAGMLVVSLMG